MKKIGLICISAGIILTHFTSCTKCAECYKWQEPTEKFCRKDYPSVESYNQAFKARQIEGYECQYVAR